MSRASTVSVQLRSASTRAVIATDVAVSVAPTNRAVVVRPVTEYTGRCSGEIQ